MTFEEYNRLKEKIDYHMDRYYNLDEPEISDYEYDQLMLRLKEAERLLAEARSTGAEAHIEEFQVPCGKVKSARLLVTAPYRKEYPVTGYERSLSTPGLDAPFYYAEDMQPVHLQNAAGKIALINGRLRRADYEKLQKAKVAPS